MVGHKVAIVSDKPQTTRRAIRGVATAPDAPARAHRPPGRAAPARRADRAHAAPRRARAGRGRRGAVRASTATRASAAPGDRFIAEALAGAEVPVVDRGQQGRPARPRRTPWRRCRPPPSSAARRRDLPGLRAHRQGRRRRSSTTSPALLPEGPFYFPPEDEFSDQPESVHARRAGARAGARPHAPGGPARRRGPGRGDRASATA